MKSTIAFFSIRSAVQAPVGTRPAPTRQEITRAEMAELFAADLYGQR